MENLRRPVQAPCGSWPSPLSAVDLASGGVSFGELRAGDGAWYWIERRPAEGGRQALVAWDGATAPRESLAPPWNARSRVHEYGGGGFCPCGDAILFTNFGDQGLYRLEPGGEPRPVAVGAGRRYADGAWDARRGLLHAVCEEHGDRGVRNFLVTVDPSAPGPGRELAGGRDFYAAPALSPDGEWLAWLCWDQPDMPWDGAELWLARLDGQGRALEPRRLAGGAGESICQPAWSPEGALHFVSDRNGWWNLYRWRDGRAEARLAMEAEFAEPAWNLGGSAYAFLPSGDAICACNRQGIWSLGRLGAGGDWRLLDLPFTSISHLVSRGGTVAFRAATPREAEGIVHLDPETGAWEWIRRPGGAALDPAYVSCPIPLEFPTAGGERAHAFFYPARNPGYAPLPGERPPLLVMSHGGPTWAAAAAFDAGIQFWTTRGFAVLDVNYRGSTGFGRAYRRALEGRWGLADVEDCVHGARYLAGLGEADGRRLLIRGGSAGGYTTLAALCFTDAFRAGASHYGVSDLEALARDTHKFEARYLDRLVAPWPSGAVTYRERSPLHYADRISAPVIFFQGLEDAVVPPAQAESMVDALRAKGVPVAYLPFAGEQHGFRRAENIRKALEAELSFYGWVLGFVPAGGPEPVAIANAGARPAPPAPEAFGAAPAESGAAPGPLAAGALAALAAPLPGRPAEEGPPTLAAFLRPLLERGLEPGLAVLLALRVPPGFPLDHREIYYDFRLGRWIRHAEPPTWRECLRDFLESEGSAEAALEALAEELARMEGRPPAG